MENLAINIDIMLKYKYNILIFQYYYTYILSTIKNTSMCIKQ